VIAETLKELGFKDLSYLLNPGIYILCLDGEVVYVGQTTNIFVRLGGNEYHRNRAWNKAYFIKCSITELDRMEALMILKFKPKEGKAFNFNNNTDARNRPASGQSGPSTHTITIGGKELSLKGRRI
jgi:hypothetical protein